MQKRRFGPAPLRSCGVKNRQEDCLEESAHHGGQDGQEERSGSHVTGALGEDGNQ